MVLSNGNIDVPMHRAIFKCVSSVFADILAGDAPSNVVTLKDIDDVSLRFLLDVICATPTKRMELASKPFDEPIDLLLLISKYDLEISFQRACLRWLPRDMRVGCFVTGASFQSSAKSYASS